MEWCCSVDQSRWSWQCNQEATAWHRGWITANWVHGYEASFAAMPSFTRGKVLYGPSSSSRLVEIGFATVLGKQMCLVLHLCPKQEGREEAVKALQQLVQGPHYGEAIQGKMRQVLGFVCWSPSNPPRLAIFAILLHQNTPLAMDGGRNFRPPLCIIESLFSHLPNKTPKIGHLCKFAPSKLSLLAMDGGRNF